MLRVSLFALAVLLGFVVAPACVEAPQCVPFKDYNEAERPACEDVIVNFCCGPDYGAAEIIEINGCDAAFFLHDSEFDSCILEECALDRGFCEPGLSPACGALQSEFRAAACGRSFCFDENAKPGDACGTEPSTGTCVDLLDTRLICVR